jgi:hypothetical protein
LFGDLACTFAKDGAVNRSVAGGEDDNEGVIADAADEDTVRGGLWAAVWGGDASKKTGCRRKLARGLKVLQRVR